MNMPIESPAATDILRAERVRHPFTSRHMQLLSREVVSPGFLRLTIGGADLGDFHSVGFDDHVKLLLPVPGQERPTLPVLVDGRPHFDGERPIARDFTPVAWNERKGTMVLEFALHNAGPATEWAKHAAMGQWLGIAGPRGSLVISTAFSWHVLLGDASALPAIERRLGELPANARAVVRVQVDHVADQRPLASEAQVDLQWVTSLPDAAAALALPAGDGYVWAAGEHADMAAVRRVLLEKPGIDPKRMRIASYWKRGEAGHHAQLSES